MSRQAKQRDYAGEWISRWYLYIADGRRLVTWARSREEARAKRIGVVRVVAAPPQKLGLRLRRRHDP